MRLSAAAWLLRAAGLLAISTTVPAVETSVEPVNQLQLKPGGGLLITTADDQFSLELGGRLQVDYDYFDGIYTSNGKTADEIYVRRAYVGLSGTVFKDWDYVVELDFSQSGETRHHELSVSYTGFEPFKVRFGRFDADFGLEEATSSKWITAIERSVIYDLVEWTQQEEENLGLELQATAMDVLYVSAGFFRQNSTEIIDGEERRVAEDDNGKGKNSYVLRAVLTPVRNDEQVVHLGAAYGRRGVQTTLGEIESDLNVRGAAEDDVNGSEATLGSASRFDRDSAWIFEAAFRHAAFSMQGEYLQRQLKGTQDESDRKSTGYNLQLAYTLTGEARKYEWDEAAFAAIKPARKDLGAWEIFYRYDAATAENPAQDAEVELHTVGVNWYANEAVKVALNYVNADSERVVSAGDSIEGRTARGDAISARLQLVF